MSTPPPAQPGLPDLPVVACAGAVVHDGAHRLLVIRRRHDPGRGLWSLPGGRVEAGEDAAQAAVREVAEETGLAVVVTGVAGRLAIPGPACVYDVTDLTARVADPRALRAGDDASDARWVDLAALRRLPVTSGLLDALAGWGLLPD